VIEPHPPAWVEPHHVPCAALPTLFSKLSSQNGPKIRPLSKKFGPFVKIASLIPLCQNKTKFLNHTSTKICENSRFFMFHMGKIRKQNILNIRPLFGHFWENSAKILPQICTAAPLTFLLGPFRVMRPKNWPVGNTAPVWPFELPNLKVKTPSFSEFPTGLAEKSAAGNHIRIF
jgi:hypothetical protein